MAPSTTQKGHHKFIGLDIYYHDMWENNSHTLEPLTNLKPNESSGD